MGIVSAVLYVIFNYVSGGQVISDSVTALWCFHRALLRHYRLHLRLVVPQDVDQEHP